MYKLKYTKEFERDLKKLSAAEQKQTANKLKLLMQNPFYSSLRTKKVQGLDNVFEMSVNMDIRILWRYENGVITTAAEGIEMAKRLREPMQMCR